MKNMYEYNEVVRKMRTFFQETKGFVEVPAQSRQSILAACEDPATISQYIFSGVNWPLPQTGQMWLERDLLDNPNVNGVFCVTTSYRNEPNPIEGRHDKIFPMFEFELKGGIDDLQKLETELLEYLGFPKLGEVQDIKYYPEGNYIDVAEKYETKELEHEHEEKLYDDYGAVFFLKNFPNYTSPFWNMKQSEDNLQANKIDVILHGVETIGSAERSCDKEEMKKQFYSISDGGYANILFSNFTKERVERELEEFLEFDFIPRSGGGIGLTRMIRALKLSNLLYDTTDVESEKTA